MTTARSYDVALTPLAVFAVLATTAVPAELRGEVGWSLRVSALDLVQNILLFVPLGCALAGRRVRAVALIAGAFALVIELAQMWGVGRFASPWDLATNTFGAVLGAQWARRRIAPARDAVITVRVTPPRLALVSVAACVVLWAWSRPTQDVGLDTWDEGYPGWLGNERTGDRPWSGRLDIVQLVGRALSPAEVAAVSAGSGTLDDPAVAYTMTQPIELDRAPPFRLPDAAIRAFVREARSRDAFSVITRITPKDLSLFGPARIVTVSTDTLFRDFDFGQDGRLLILRVRTRVSGTNAERVRVTTRGVLTEGQPVHAIATYDGRIGRIFVDGVLAARADFGAAGCASRALCDWAAPAAWGLLGACAALIVLAFLSARPSAAAEAWRLIGAMVGAVLAIVIAAATPVSAIVVGTHGLLPLLAVVGGLSVWYAQSRARSAQRRGLAASLL